MIWPPPYTDLTPSGQAARLATEVVHAPEAMRCLVCWMVWLSTPWLTREMP